MKDDKMTPSLIMSLPSLALAPALSSQHSACPLLREGRVKFKNLQYIYFFFVPRRSCPVRKWVCALNYMCLRNLVRIYICGGGQDSDRIYLLCVVLHALA
jgi:hypothetical protein